MDFIALMWMNVTVMFVLILLLNVWILKVLFNVTVLMDLRKEKSNNSISPKTQIFAVFYEIFLNADKMKTIHVRISMSAMMEAMIATMKAAQFVKM